MDEAAGSDGARRRASWRRRLTLAVLIAVLALPLGCVAAAPRLSRVPAAPAAATWPALPSAAPGAPASLDGLADNLPLVARDLPDALSQKAVRDYDQARLFDTGAAAQMFLDAWGALIVPRDDAPGLTELGRRLLLKDYPPGIITLDAAPAFSQYVAAALAPVRRDPRNIDRLNNAAVALFLLGAGGQYAPIAPITAFGVRVTYDHIAPNEFQSAALVLLTQAYQTLPANRGVRLNLAFIRSLGYVPERALPPAIEPVERQVGDDPADVTARLLYVNLLARLVHRDDPLDSDPGGLEEDAARCDDTSGLYPLSNLGGIFAELDPLIRDPKVAPLGYAARGDALMTVATLHQSGAPYFARALVACALNAYDTALTMTADPGVYAGRAAALDFLASTDDPATAPVRARDALAAQQHAIDTAENPIALRLGRALLREHASAAIGRSTEPPDQKQREMDEQLTAMRDDARAALGMLLNGWDPPDARVRFVTAPFTGLGPTAGDRGYLGFSYGSDRDSVPVQWASQGGGGIISLDVIPLTQDPLRDHRLRLDFPPVSAMALTAEAGILTADPDGAGRDAARWMQALSGSVRPGDAAPRFVLGDAERTYEQMWTRGVDAAKLVAGQKLAPAEAAKPYGIGLTNLGAAAVSEAATALRRAGRFADAASLCGTAAAALPAGDSGRFDALLCQGESAYLAGDDPAASATLHTLLLEAQRADQAYQDAQKQGQKNLTFPNHAPIEEIQLEAGAAAQAAGDAKAAGADFGALADLGDGPATDFAVGYHILGLLKLGDLDLDAAADTGGREGRLDDALAAYGGVIQAVQAADFQEDGDVESTLAAPAIVQRARNNRAIARLWSAQEREGEPPVCRDERGDPLDACTAARDDFNGALDADPRNPIYLMNAGWVARLLGDDDTARERLEAAVAVDPSLAPAANDLGVLDAEEGHDRQAADAFRAALRAQPSYDLAAWNLGVLTMRRGRGVRGLLHAVAGIPRGEALLARAVTHNHELAGHELGLQADERIYRFVAVSNSQLTPSPLLEGAGGAAIVLAVIALAGGIFHLLQEAVPHVGGDWVFERSAHALRPVTGRAVTALRALGPVLAVPTLRRRVPEDQWPWLLTLPVLLGATAWIAWHEVVEAVLRPALLVQALGAVLLAVITHEAGHRIAARLARAEVVPKASAAGIALAVVLLPVGLSGGPYVGHEVEHATERRALWVHLGGPAATFIYALAAYLLLRVQPMPLLGLIAEAQLAATSYALLPVEPLDGRAILEKRPLVYFLMCALVLALVIALRAAA